MNQMSPSASSTARVSFLYSGAGSDTDARIKPILRPKPLVLPPVPASPVVNPSKPRQPHTSWVHSAKQKEEAGALSRASFLSAVIERTSKLYGYIPSFSGETPADMTAHLDKDCGEASTLTAEAQCIATQTTMVPSARLRPAVPVKVLMLLHYTGNLDMHVCNLMAV